MISDEAKTAIILAHERRYALVALSESLAEHLSPDDRYIIWDYVDHNEQDVAFDHLLYRLFDESMSEVNITLEQAEKIHELGKAIGYTAASSSSYKVFLSLHFPSEI